METLHLTSLRNRMLNDCKQWEAVVVNREQGVELVTNFNSKIHSLKNVLHKIELDLMTNLHHDFKEPVFVGIKEVEA